MTEEQLSRLIIGESAAMRRLRAHILRLAPTNTRVLIQGPTGAGKELVAQALHTASGRRGRLVAVNVCAIPDAMFEATLFGHVRGAFTGALRDSAGLLAEADGGTLFLDEIGSLNLAEQTKLLRALEHGVFRPVGANRDRCSTFRLVSATNEDMARLVQSGRFRADLWYRLRGTPILVPPLCERQEDIPALLSHFLDDLNSNASLTPGAIRVLQDYAWPGNVRELRQVVEAMLAFAEHGSISTSDALGLLHPAQERELEDPEWRKQRQALLELLASCGGNTAQAALRLGVHRVTVYRRMQRLGIRPATERGFLLEAL